MSVDSTEIKSVDVLIGKVLKWSYDRRIIQESTAKDQFLKASSEMGELADSILKGDRQGAVDDFGDVLVCLINAAEIMKIPLQEALEHAYNEIKDRKGVMFQGAFIKQTDDNYPRIMKALGIEEEGMDKVISLKTLDKATAQDVFNHVVNHLLTQKEKSVNSEGACMYRGLNGLKCAAGCLIADDEYSPGMEYKTWIHLTGEGAFRIGNDELVVPIKHSDLIHDLQIIHDHDAPDKWEESLRKLCAEHMLKWEYEGK